MVVRNRVVRPQHVIDEAVRRYMSGESAVALAKYYKISKPGFYLWVNKYRQSILDSMPDVINATEPQVVQDIPTLTAQVRVLTDENARLRNKIVSLLLQAGQI